MIKDEEKLNRELCTPGSKVYYWEPQHAWSIGEVVQDDGKHFTVRGLDYSATKKGALSTEGKLGDDRVWPVREDVLDEDVADLLDLTVLHDATIQRCLYVRYMKDMVYTNIGAIVVALNPWNFKIPWYTDDNMPSYLAEGEVVKNCAPHSWSQAHNTYHDLRRDAENQTILISGESGAGKTEAAKIVMKYLGTLSCMHGVEADRENAKKVAFNINQASPVLEGFGNAKTVRNDNSSRFGKFMKVQFNEAGNLVGAYTIKYLLEKSRIVTANPNERCYHAFYLCAKGKDAGRYGIAAADIPASHVNAGSCVDIPGVDDAEDYDLCVAAMADCGFSGSDVDGVWRAVAGVFHLLRCGFEAIDDDSSKPNAEGGAFIDLCAEQWQVDTSVLAAELSTTTLQTRDGDVTKTLTVAKAIDCRDAVCKGLYDAVFGWEVEKINQNTDSGGGQNWIGLLDIFGFEDFEYNSFEQICINLANETLQNHYNNYIFTKDMDECRAEGIDVTEVKCPDNSPCLRLMVDRIGVFALLDDECSVGTGTDDGFLSKVIENCASNPFFGQKKMAKNSFIVHHYASSVNYTVESWLQKNRDTLKPAMKLLMRASANPLIASVLPEPEENARAVTLGGFFRSQLVQLMDLINSTTPHWIRCVKPHPAKKPLLVDGCTMMTQLESSGVLGTVKIRKAGYPVRPTFAKFAARFKVIAQGPYPSMDSPPAALAELCAKVLAAADLGKQRAQVGKTRVFLKNDANQHLELARERALRERTATLQRAARSKASERERRRRALAAAARTVQAELRDWIARTSDSRAEARRVRQERARVFAQAARELHAEEEELRAEMEEEEDAAVRALASTFFDDSRALASKAESDALALEDLLTEARNDKAYFFQAALPAYTAWREEMAGLLLVALEADEEERRAGSMQARDAEWVALIAAFDYELGFVQLSTMHRTELRVRMLMLQLEAVQRREITERRGFLQEFLDSLESSVAPWIDLLCAVRYWSEHIRRRRERVRDTRTQIHEMRLYEQNRGAVVRNEQHRGSPARRALPDVWVGCKGIPDAEQMLRAVDRPAAARASRGGGGSSAPAEKPPLDGSSGRPCRDCSPHRGAGAGGTQLMRSPPRTGGRSQLIAKSPMLPDYLGHQQERRYAAHTHTHTHPHTHLHPQQGSLRRHGKARGHRVVHGAAVSDRAKQAHRAVPGAEGGGCLRVRRHLHVRVERHQHAHAAPGTGRAARRPRRPLRKADKAACDEDGLRKAQLRPGAVQGDGTVAALRGLGAQDGGVPGQPRDVAGVQGGGGQGGVRDPELQGGHDPHTRRRRRRRPHGARRLHAVHAVQRGAERVQLLGPQPHAAPAQHEVHAARGLHHRLAEVRARQLRARRLHACGGADARPRDGRAEDAAAASRGSVSEAMLSE